MFSFKTGYHNGYNIKYDEGFPEGMIFDGSVSLGVSKSILLGVNFDYWKKNNVSVNPYLTNILINKNYSGFGYRFYVQYRKTVFNNIDIFFDAGIGSYKISNEYVYNNTYSSNHHSYLNAGINGGLSYRINKLFGLSVDLSHYRLIDFDLGGSTIMYTTNIKFGPVLYFKIK